MTKTHPPPPPRPGERRAHARVELLAQVQVSRQAEVHIMPTVNASCGGMFLQGNPFETPELRVGVDLDLTLFDPGDLGAEVRATAKVARIESSTDPAKPSGFGLEFTRIDEANLARLRRLLDL